MSARAPDGDFGFEFVAMASGCELRLAAMDEAPARRAADAAIAEVRRIEQKFSRYRDDSVVARINRGAGGAPVACDAETWQLLGYAEALWRESGGLFDITSGVLRRAWDFRSGRVPGDEELATLRPLIGWRLVERHAAAVASTGSDARVAPSSRTGVASDDPNGDAGTVRLPHAGMELDFGGFGKEYAADRAAAVLQSFGVRSGYVNLGGDLRAIGPQPDGRPWRIGIQDPRVPGRSFASLPLAAGGLATSGDYERFFERDGVRYCHILDPRSGRPVSHWRSVSVLAPLTVAAGSFSTIAMLKGAQAPSWLDALGLPWLAVDATGIVHRGAAAPG